MGNDGINIFSYYMFFCIIYIHFGNGSFHFAHTNLNNEKSFNNYVVSDGARPIKKKLQDNNYIDHSVLYNPYSWKYLLPLSDDASLHDDSIFLQYTEAFSSHLRWISNNELGVTNLQDVYNTLPYTRMTVDEEKDLEMVIVSLENKVKTYISLLEQMVDASLYSFDENAMDSQHFYLQYYPCCVIPDHYLMYDSHFGAKVNSELWCDSGFGHGEFYLPEDFIPTPKNLTDSTSIGSDCGQSSRHRSVYELTTRPVNKNIFLLFDLGRSVTPHQLLLSKLLGHHILQTLSHSDAVNIGGIGSTFIQPPEVCFKNGLVAVSYDVLESLKQFIDFMDVSHEPTNYTLGLLSAVDMVQNVKAHVNLVYITSGFVTSRDEIKTIMRGLSSKQSEHFVNITISLLILGNQEEELEFPEQFASAFVNQNFELYGISAYQKKNQGYLIYVNSTVDIPSVVNKLYNYLFGFRTYNKSMVFISDPFWDAAGKEMVVTFSATVPLFDNKMLGLVGIDVSLSVLLEDVIHHISPSHSYVFVIDANGNVVSHPKLGKKGWHIPLYSAEITLLESGILENTLLEILHSYEGFKISKHIQPNIHFWWKRVHTLNWTFVIAWPESEHKIQTLSEEVGPLLPAALFHRLDLLFPKEAKVCRYFNQLATLDDSTVFLTSGAYQHPANYLATEPETRSVMHRLMAYLSDGSQLIANPGVRNGIRSEAASLYKVTQFWKKLFGKSKFHKYIVRRYACSPYGVMFSYPGTILEKGTDPREQAWFLKAMNAPGKITVIPPFLDPGGAGFVITVSHSVFQGHSAALPRPSDPVAAVLAADFTLGYWYKLLLDFVPECQAMTLNSTVGVGIRCFLMDKEGNLVVHPVMFLPYQSSTDVPRHITHQEPLLSMELLGKGLSDGILIKKSCSRQWHGVTERDFSVSIPKGKVISSGNFFDSSVNRVCLNCNMTEAEMCECPCKCTIPLSPCHSEKKKTFKKLILPSCPHEPDPVPVLHYTVPLLSSLEKCIQSSCVSYTTEEGCLGIVGCSWCMFSEDGKQLSHPQCLEQEMCHGGVLGGPSPYSVGLSVNQEMHNISSNPVGPVAGGIMVFFVLLSLGVYCYKQHLGPSRHLCSSSACQDMRNQQQLYSSSPPNLNNDDDLIDAVIPAAATVSPYRINPCYRRPFCYGESSDPGYSTMTPHEDSENFTCTDTSTPIPTAYHARCEEECCTDLWSEEDIKNNFYENSLSSPKFGPRKIVVPVTVHMVDVV